MLSGLKKVKELQKQADEERASWGSYVPYFDLVDGQTAEVRFNGGADEPLLINVHSIKRGKQFSTVVCAKGVEGHEGCVGCWCVSQGDKSVGRPSKKAVFNLVDKRWVHKMIDEKRSQPGRERYRYEPCSDDASCKLCRKKVPRERAGQKTWTVSLTWAAALAGLNDKLARKCKNCGGKVKCIGYLDADGDPADIGDMDTEEIQEAIEKEKLQEVLECNNCDSPVRASIFDVDIEVTRTGSGTTTSYNFSASGIQDPEDWVLECEPADLEKTAGRPMKAEKQAERLGVRNPFDGGGGATSYGEEEEEDPFENE